MEPVAKLITLADIKSILNLYSSGNITYSQMTDKFNEIAEKNLRAYSIVDKARRLAITAHSSTNHLRDGHPYEDVHLKPAVEVGLKYIHLIPEEDRDNVIAAIWLHDSIDDARLTYNHIKHETNEEIAELVFALSNLRGRNSAARAGAEYYMVIRLTKYASFAKLCDRIANVRYGYNHGKTGMYKKYKREFDHFHDQLYEETYEPLWAELKKLFA